MSMTTSLKCHLSSVLPVAEAAELLGRPTVTRLVHALWAVRKKSSNSSSNNNNDVDNSEAEGKELAALIESLFYDLRKTAASAPPPTIAQAWQQWTTSLGLDKSIVWKFAAPHAQQPFSGPDGHMGLYDCLTYALQAHAVSSTASSYYGGATTAAQGIRMPDLIIALAVARRYREYQEQAARDNEQDKDALLPEEEVNRRDGIVWTMATLAFGVYNAYQKKGTVTRETIHRFLTDVLRDDSHKQAKVIDLLNVVFETQTNGGAPADAGIHAFVSELQFCRRIRDTMSVHRRHILLDWLACLLTSFVPPPELPETVRAYLDVQMQRWNNNSAAAGGGGTAGSHGPGHDLDKQRLYEVKRRFHSLVQASNCLLKGDPMKGSSSEFNGGSNSSIMADLKQAITASSFCQAVSTPSAEMGHGGYLPESVAQVIFAAGAKKRHIESSAVLVDEHGDPSNGSEYNDEDGDDSDEDAQKIPLMWTLDQVLEFGGLAVRVGASPDDDPDVPLLAFLYNAVAGRQNRSATDDDGDAMMEDSSRTTTTAPRSLNRRDVAQLLVLMLQHAEFRLDTTAAHSGHDGSDDETTEDMGTERSSDTQNEIKLSNLEEDALVHIDTAYLLGIIPPGISRNAKDDDEAQLSVLIDYALQNCAEKDCMTLPEFFEWNMNAEGTNKSRLGPIMVDLRLVASVLFGIPPTLASMEVMLIAELERRHKARFPQTKVSRRGPRGTIWYLVDSVWLSQWTNHVRAVSGTPEDATHQYPNKRGVRGIDRINNASLLAENGSLALRGDIRWKNDYEILPPLAWHGLQAWYDGGPPIHRSVVRYIAASGPSPHSSRPRIPTENEIELYPFFVSVWLCDTASRGLAKPFQQNFQLSRVTPVGVTLVALCKELQVDPDLARLWVVSENPMQVPPPPPADDASLSPPGGRGLRQQQPPQQQDWILDLRTNIVDQRKRRSQDKAPISLMLEIKDAATGKWPRGADGKDWSFHATGGPEKAVVNNLGDGVVGLYNMGNTCYLNSSIQCLSHTPIFREYFTSKAYVNDINTTNPLGHQGHLAQVSAVLINSLWKQFNQGNNNARSNGVTAPGSFVMVNAPSLTPKTFKESLGGFNDHFAGNEQHDAQELLAFLLGGLSEDLNRIVDKPYIEAPDSDGRPDQELADIWWSNHLKREMSIVVALFTGQYKSLLTCRSCKYESARFEPFSCLQLPLPEDDQLSVNLIVYPLRTGAPTLKYAVRVSAEGNFQDVLIALAKLQYEEEHGPPSEEEAEERQQLYVEKSRNFSVVDTKDGYITKIVPNQWTLQDSQNKDTGDLPVVHVYELIPAVEDEVTVEKVAKDNESPGDGDEAETTDDSDDGKVAFKRQRSAFLAIAQRRSEVTSPDYLHPLAHRVFGTPLLIRVNDLESVSGSQLYDLIAERLKNVVPRSALKFLEHPSKPNAAKNGSSEASDDEAKRSTRTTSTMEDVSAGPVPRYGFRLRTTARDGRRCLLCPWYDGCVGCMVFDNDKPASVMNGDSLVVDWHFAVGVTTIGLQQQIPPSESNGDMVRQPPPTPRGRIAAVSVKNHPSAGGSKLGQVAGAITLEQCLDSFAKEEKIPEAYCSQCKDFRVQTKRMSLWRLPPVVIIHLKRFQFTQHMRRKLRDLVVFPLEGLDLSRIIAPSSKARSCPSEENGEASENSENNGEESTPDGRSEMLYDLYGVVHHQGALSGGHYVASLKSEIDGKWRLFNDAQIYEIHDRDVVDASAYILFYMRRDVSKAKLSDFWEASDVGKLSEDEVHSLLKGKSDKCVIS